MIRRKHRAFGVRLSYLSGRFPSNYGLTYTRLHDVGYANCNKKQRELWLGFARLDELRYLLEKEIRGEAEL